MTLGGLLRDTREQLAGAGVDDAALDARLIVQHFTGTSRTDELARPDMEISGEAVAAVKAALARRIAGEPVHRILGSRAFHTLELALSPETLEPRSDTEVLVDRVIPHLRAMTARHGELRVLDLGTGTGAIALALLNAVPEARALGVDIAAGAVETALANARAHGLESRFEGAVSDWFGGVHGKFHAILSNPPYIRTKDIDGLSVEVRRHDPVEALDGGMDGLDAYRAIAAGAGPFLEADAIIAVEIGSSQKDEVAAVFAGCGYHLVEAARDLSGHDRALIFGH